MNALSNPDTAYICTGTWQCIYAYQTLIAGVLAIVAAIIAAMIAWRQLSSMRVQSDVLVIELLKQQIGRVKGSREWVGKQLKTFDNDVLQGAEEFDRFKNGAVDAHWAFDQGSRGTRLVDEVEQLREEWRLPDALDVALGTAITRLRELSDTLDKIHRPASQDQSGEDYEFSDEQWAAIKDEAKQAEGQVSGLADQLYRALKSLESAFDAELKVLRDRMQRVGRTIVSG
jgi:hypothetical protein